MSTVEDREREAAMTEAFNQLPSTNSTPAPMEVTENSVSPSAPDTNNNIDASSIMFLQLDTRLYHWVWDDEITRTEVIDALDIEHSDDITKIVKPVKFQTGLFKILADDYARYANITIVIRNKEFVLKPIMRRQAGLVYFPEREGTYVTIFDANDPEYRFIDHDLFDEYFRNIDGVEIIVQTQPQRDKKRKSAITGHRFLRVKHNMDNGEKIDLGSQITIQGCRFNLMYDGMKKYCYLCAMKHGKECPRRIRNAFLNKLRAEKTKKAKMYADSTLRNTNQCALTTNVPCMGGGGISQICNAIALDEKHEQVVIHAGNNEIMNMQTPQEFLYTVEKTKEKLESSC